MYSSKTTGKEELIKALNRYDRRLGDAFSKAVMEAAKEFIEKNDENVPMDTGALRRSGGAHQVGSNWETVTYMGYGYDIMELYVDSSMRIRVPRLYAVWQHEATNVKHPFGMDHYLEEGIEYYKADIFDHIRLRLSKVRT